MINFHLPLRAYNLLNGVIFSWKRRKTVFTFIQRNHKNLRDSSLYFPKPLYTKSLHQFVFYSCTFHVPLSMNTLFFTPSYRIFFPPFHSMDLHVRLLVCQSVSPSVGPSVITSLFGQRLRFGKKSCRMETNSLGTYVIP